MQVTNCPQKSQEQERNERLLHEFKHQQQHSSMAAQPTENTPAMYEISEEDQQLHDMLERDFNSKCGEKTKRTSLEEYTQRTREEQRQQAEQQEGQQHQLQEEAQLQQENLQNQRAQKTFQQQQDYNKAYEAYREKQRKRKLPRSHPQFVPEHEPAEVIHEHQGMKLIMTNYTQDQLQGIMQTEQRQQYEEDRDPRGPTEEQQRVQHEEQQHHIQQTEVYNVTNTNVNTNWTGTEGQITAHRMPANPNKTDLYYLSPDMQTILAKMRGHSPLVQVVSGDEAQYILRSQLTPVLRGTEDNTFIVHPYTTLQVPTTADTGMRRHQENEQPRI